MSGILGGIYICLVAWLPLASLWFLNDYVSKNRNYTNLFEIAWYLLAACSYFLLINLAWTRLQTIFDQGKIADGPYLIGMLLGALFISLLLGYLGSTILFRVGVNLGFKIKVKGLDDDID